MGIFNSLADFVHGVLGGLIILTHMAAGLFVVSIVYAPASLPQPTAISNILTIFPKAPSKFELATSTVANPPKKLSHEKAVSLAPTQSTQTQPTPKIDVEATNASTRAALANILCTTRAGGSFEPISGSGVFIDSRGVILTNAHVGQYFLLRNYLVPGNIDCVVRTGSPAQPLYTAELMYLPPSWIAENAPKINARNATGTGEADYALLRVTGTTNPSGTLPATFPYLSMTGASPYVGDQALLAGYAAGFLGGADIQKNLYITSAVAKVTDIYSFTDEQHVDLVAVPGTVVSQAGSSGGAVVRFTDNKLLGIIVTDTNGTTTADRNLFAITIAHIDRNLKVNGKGGLAELLSQNPVLVAKDFAENIAPAETKKLEDALGH